MSAGRVVAAVAASLAVGGCAVVVVGMAGAHSRPDAAPTVSVSAAPTSRPAFIPVAAPTSARTPKATARPVRPTASPSKPSAVAPSVVAPRVVAPPTASRAATTARRAVVAAPTHTAPATHAPATHAPATHAPAPRAVPTSHRAAKPTGKRLPLRYPTGSATRVITVTASSHSSTVATLQAWTKVAGGWRKYGSSVTAHVGAQGIGKASETTSHTPTGSFTLTQAFGRRSDPGTALPYFRTTPSDYWISDPGRLYNTHQRCSSCGYDDGHNERLYYETPYYNYAVVIDYNTRNAPGGVHAGKGSAFFLHVTDGKPTAGCVAVPQTRLIPLMRWLTPSAHPRILIGVT